MNKSMLLTLGVLVGYFGSCGHEYVKRKKEYENLSEELHSTFGNAIALNDRITLENHKIRTKRWYDGLFDAVSGKA